MWTPEFEAYVAPARVKPQLWRLLVGLIVAAAVYIGPLLVVFVGAGIVIGALAGDGPALSSPWFQAFVEGRNPPGAIVLLLTFGGMMAGAFVAVQIHGRSIASLFGPRLVAMFVPAALITLLAGAASAVLSLGGDMALIPNTAMSVWLTFLPFALIALLVQTGAEEVLFRGYLQQQLAARFRAPWIWMGVPSVLFGALHTDLAGFFATGQFGDNDGLIFAATGLVGLLAADLTRVTGGIGAAWGLHFANNVQALLIVSLPDMLSGLSLYHTPFGPDDTEVLPMLLVQDMVVLVIIWALIRLWLARGARREPA